MDQARCLMSTKQKNSLINTQVLASTNPAYDNSWEEQAFAEDKAGPLGWCVWPPRSYTCSFCKKEFQSSHALGGHMNLHRRERAILKQSATAPNNEILQHQSQISSLVCNPNSDSHHVFLASTPSNSKVSTPSAQVNYDENDLFPNFTYPSVEESHKRVLISNDKPYFKKDKIMNSNNLWSRFKLKSADLSANLNLVMSRLEEKDESMNCKRQRTDPTASSLPKPCSADRDLHKSEAIEVCPNSIEDLDLELRLGDRPNVK